MISGTIFDNGRTLSAQPIEAFYDSVSHFDALSVGINCAVGVELMRGSIEALSAICRTRISCYPNAGMPDGFGGFLGDRDHTAAVLGEFARNGWLNIVGGCCGTTPRLDRGRSPRPSRACRLGKFPNCRTGRRYSGMEPLVDPPRDELHHDRRADQHHRLEAVRPADPERRLRDGPGRRPRAGRGRAPTSSTSTWTRASSTASRP